MAKIQFDHKIIRDYIESNPDFALELRTKILNTACKNVLTEVVSEEAQNVMREYVEKNITSVPSCYRVEQITLKDKIKQVITNEIEKQTTKEIRELISEKYSLIKLDETLKSYYDQAIEKTFKRIDKIIEQRFNIAIAKYIDDKITEKINKMIGILKEDNKND